MPRVLFILVCLLVLQFQLFAQVEIGGYIKTDNRFRTQTAGNPFTWNENCLQLELKAKPSNNIRLYSELRLRTFGFPKIETSADLQRREKDAVQPWGLEFNEAYAEMSNFLIKKLDIKIGRQRIAWGSADKMNPTDNLNPDDLEDIFDFGKHLGSNAVQANYYAGQYTLTGVLIPIFTPAVLPPPDWVAAFTPSFNLPIGLHVRNMTDRIEIPRNTFKESSMFGLKISRPVFEYDFSLSYFNGRDDLPLITEAQVTPVDTYGKIDVDTKLIYPEMQVLGADFSGQLFDIGLWAEAAVVFPKKYGMTIYLPNLQGTQEMQSTALDDNPYVRYVFGSDYTFKNGLYFNAQFIHGLFHERGRDNLGNYLVFGLEKKFLQDEVKITFGSGALEITDFGDIKNNYAYVFNPVLAYYPIDNAEILVGAYIIDGKSSTTFGRVKKNDEVYVKVKYSF